jgi:pimeloyl-ACP methyl ester carboxylesterase
MLSPARGALRRRILAACAAGAGLYLAAGYAAALYLTMPHHAPVVDPPGGRRVAISTADGLRLAAWENDVPGARATAVLAHGYRNDRRLLGRLVPALAARGFRAVAFDFRGHGESDGDRITLGPDESRDVGAVLDHAATLGGRVVYVGFSMGAAAYLLSGREAQAAVLDSPYATLRTALSSRLASAHVPPPLALPALGFFGARIGRDVSSVRPVDAVPGLARPTLFVFAEHDIWVSAEARGLYRAAAGGRVSIHEIAGRGHADHFDQAWEDRVVGFLASAVTEP